MNVTIHLDCQLLFVTIKVENIPVNRVLIPEFKAFQFFLFQFFP